jgi:hypothetical protein
VAFERGGGEATETPAETAMAVPRERSLLHWRAGHRKVPGAEPLVDPKLELTETVQVRGPAEPKAREPKHAQRAPVMVRRPQIAIRGGANTVAGLAVRSRVGIVLDLIAQPGPELECTIR